MTTILEQIKIERKELLPFEARSVSTYKQQDIRRLARDFLRWSGFEFRANANVYTLIMMLLDECIKWRKQFYADHEILSEEIKRLKEDPPC